MSNKDQAPFDIPDPEAAGWKEDPDRPGYWLWETEQPVSEAPEDGKQYGRQDADWTEIVIPPSQWDPSGGGINTNASKAIVGDENVEGVGLYASGSIRVWETAQNNNYLWSGFGGGSITSQIQADGDAKFSGTVDCGAVGRLGFASFGFSTNVVYGRGSNNVAGGVDLGTDVMRWANGYFSGTVNATSFVGDGSQLTGIDLTGYAKYSDDPAPFSGTVTASKLESTGGRFIGAGSGVAFSGNNMYPSNPDGTSSTDVLTIGTAAYKFKDAYFSGTIDANLYQGGFGALNTGGVKDWNDDSATASGQAQSMLLGSDANGPDGSANYFHPFTFEYARVTGDGRNVTQLAIPYRAERTSLWMRSRYNSTWGAWIEISTPDAVKTSGDQTIGGTKTFSSDVLLSSGKYIKTSGTSGWMNTTHGGGWYQSDATWIRAYGSKPVYVANNTANAISTAGDVVAYYSDERLKTKTGEIENALDKVEAIDCFYYTNNDIAKSLGYEGDDQQVGVSAQSVKAVMPEVVCRAPVDMDADGGSLSGEDYMTVKYERLVPLLLQSIKELTARVRELENGNS